MKLTLRKPDGTVTTLSEDQLTIGWNTGEIASGWQVQRPGETQWRTVAEQLGLPAEAQARPAASGPSASGSSGGAPSAVSSRYRDAYRVAAATAAVGGTLKVLAFCAGGLALILPMMGVSSAIGGGGAVNGAGLLLGLVAGLAVGVPLYALGILVSAQGQVLKATLDTAVNTSPHLDNDQKARIIGG